MVKMARTALRRTYEWRCSRQSRITGINGSNNSGSFNLHKKRSVAPRKNSFGCCKSLRYASQTRIISCNNLPSGVVFGTISQKINNSFFIVWFCDGITNRMIVINRPGNRSPFNSNLMTFFRVSIWTFSSPCSVVVDREEEEEEEDKFRFVLRSMRRR